MTVDTETPTPIDPTPKSRSKTSISVSVGTVAWLATTAALVVTLLVVSGFLIAARSGIADRDALAADNRHAEQVATDYAVGASTVDFGDFNAWVARLKANTTPQLANKFDTTAPKLREILTPLKWTSTANPITAKVVSQAGGVYKINAFITVNSTNAQNPDGGQTTVTYNVTVDRDAGWKVSDVGGIDGALPLK
ncbi:hypothetical protein ACWIGW_42430 [Nocardia brasiliensis]